MARRRKAKPPATRRPPALTRAELEAVDDERLRAALLRIYDHRHRHQAPPAADPPQARLPYKED